MDPRGATPADWRETLAVALPDVDADGADWLGNHNAATPWRCVVGDVRLADGRRVVLKFHTDAAEWRREHAAARFLAESDAPTLAPECLGADPTRKTLVFSYVGGRDLIHTLAGPNAREALLHATRAIAHLHRWADTRITRWLELCPEDAEPRPFPLYDQPDDEIIAPFMTVGGDREALAAGLATVRTAMTSARSWLGFTHSDLQTRHLFCAGDGIRIVDWECAGLRHRLYDLACLLAKPVVNGYRLPRWAREAVVETYARECGFAVDRVWHELVLVLAYERLIGVAEEQHVDSPEARAELADLLALAVGDERLSAFAETAEAWGDRARDDGLPLFAGLGADA